MRHFFTKSIPPFSRVLLIESGSRDLFENLLPILYPNHPEIHCDLVTCYAGAPKNFRSDQGSIFRVTDYPDSPSRQRLYAELGRNRYVVLGIICSTEAIMTKWKWMLALRVPAKFLILNENGDYFWLHRENSSILRKFVLFRMGLQGAGALRTVGRLLIFPFSLLFLLMYAFVAHSRRRLRLIFKT